MSTLPLELIHQVSAASEGWAEIYLVGGAVRDALLEMPIHDLDFMVPAESLHLARQVANTLGAAFYVLDSQRGSGRLIYTPPGSQPITLDFAVFRGKDLQTDLTARDFTINALALNLRHLDLLIDPLHGTDDLQKRILRCCSPDSFNDDPVRILRAIRLAVSLKLKMTPQTLQQLKAAVPLLPSVTPERQRDELFRILECPRPASALRLVTSLGLLPVVLPEWLPLKGLGQRPPHVHDALEHTLSVINHLSILLSLFLAPCSEEYGANLINGEVISYLGRYRQHIKSHLSKEIVPGRSRLGLLFMAAVCHDIGKPTSRSVDQTGGVHFFDHEKTGASLAAQRARAWMLSNSEVERIRGIVAEHMRVHNLSRRKDPLTSRNIYRFFRACGDYGVDVCLLSLADLLATFETTLSPVDWHAELEVCRLLMQSWFDEPEKHVAPPKIITGDDLMQELHLQPGPQVGALLAAIHEAQATGEIQDRHMALVFARDFLKDYPTQEDKNDN